MAGSKMRTCPECGRSLPGRGLYWHLVRGHGLPPSAARAAASAAPTEADDEAETMKLVDRLLTIRAKLYQLADFFPDQPGKGSAIPAGALATAFSVYQEEVEEIVERLEAIHPPDDRGRDFDWGYADEFLAQWCLYEVRGLGITPGGTWLGNEEMARRMTPARRRGYVDAEQLDLDRWRFTLTEPGAVALGILAP